MCRRRMDIEPKMAYAIELLFEEKGETAVRHLWHSLAEAGVNDSMVRFGATPHVTLGGFADEPLDMELMAEKLRLFARAKRPFSLTLSYLGVFNTNPAVVYAGATMSLTLLETHRFFHELVAGVGQQPWDYYLPDAWVPHCTLAEGVQGVEVGTAVSHCQRLTLPIHTTINRITVAQPGQFPVRHLLTLPLLN